MLESFGELTLRHVPCFLEPVASSTSDMVPVRENGCLPQASFKATVTLSTVQRLYSSNGFTCPDGKSWGLGVMPLGAGEGILIPWSTAA